jgi:hypothetical protein
LAQKSGIKTASSRKQSRRPGLPAQPDKLPGDSKSYSSLIACRGGDGGGRSRAVNSSRGVGNIHRSPPAAAARPTKGARPATAAHQGRPAPPPSLTAGSRPRVECGMTAPGIPGPGSRAVRQAPRPPTPRPWERAGRGRRAPRPPTLGPRG